MTMQHSKVAFFYGEEMIGIVPTINCLIFNPLKCSGIRWLYLKLFSTIQV